MNLATALTHCFPDLSTPTNAVAAAAFVHVAAVAPTLCLIDGKSRMMYQYAAFGEEWELICNEKL